MERKLFTVLIVCVVFIMMARYAPGLSNNVNTAIQADAQSTDAPSKDLLRLIGATGTGGEQIDNDSNQKPYVENTLRTAQLKKNEGGQPSEKSIPGFFTWFEKQLILLEELKDNDILTTLALLSQMDNGLHEFKEANQSWINKVGISKTGDSTRAPDEREPPAEETESTADDQERFFKLENRFKKLAEVIIEQITNNADMVISSIDPFVGAELENNLEKLKKHYEEIGWSAKTIFELYNKIEKSEILNGKAEWRVLDQLPATRKIRELNNYFRGLILKLYKAIGQLDGWRYQVDRINDQYTGISEATSQMDTLLSDPSDISCDDLVSANKKAQEILDNDVIKQLQYYEDLVKIFQLDVEQKLTQFSKRHSGDAARRLLRKQKRKIGHQVFDLSELVRSRESEVVEVQKRQKELKALIYVLGCDI